METKKRYIYHPAYGRLLKTYLFFDIAHLIKNIRNSLLNREKLVFPTFSFDKCDYITDDPEGFILWKMF